jgi:phosphatidylserine/phosphatidylglycerophosphate/cardiolipin synthase-like enzyme
MRSRRTTIGSTLVFLALALVVFLYRSLTSGGQPQATPTPALLTSATPSLDWFAVYFTEPMAAGTTTFKGGPDEHLAEAINQARLSVDIAAYDFDLHSLRDALLAAQARGVKVRMVTDSDNIDNPEVVELKEAGIPILGDRREALMHNKFVVIDRLEVWGGSMNYTVNDAYKNNNNLIRIRSTRLAEDYTAEFEEMFVADQFGPTSPANTPYPRLTVEGTPIEVYFSPDDGVAAHVVETIAKAQHNIVFLAYSFTSDAIAAAMLERANAGVTVAGVFETNQVSSNTGDEYDKLRKAGLDVRLDGNPRNMHHKVMVIDEQIVIVGSYNFSESAEKKNDENLLIIYNPIIASQFIAEFQKVFGQAK